LDSGASQHLVGDRSLFANINTATTTAVMLANGATTPTGGEGSVPIQVLSALHELVDVELPKTLFMPGATINLLSVSRLASAGHRAVLDHCAPALHLSSGLVIHSSPTS
jgi:hypothetical protein